MLQLHCSIWSKLHPVQLLSGIFFICKDRAWTAIPLKTKGGLCRLRCLTVLAPNNTMAHTLAQIKNQLTILKKIVTLKLHIGLKPLMASLLPWATAAKALKQLDGIGCCLGMQTNATSIILSELLTDVSAVRHATLQNRAVIDFLLAHGHGCEDFEGFCCMNLSDHSESIYHNISLLKEGVGKLQIEQGSNWTNHLFKGWNL